MENFMVDTTCSICYAEFLDIEDLEIHQTQVHSPKPSKVQCQFCSVTHVDLEEYALHIRDDHIKDIYICELCTRMFLDADEHHKHVNKHYQHPNKYNYTCSQCPFISKSVKLLENHELTRHEAGKEGVFITECFPHLSSVLNINALKFIQGLKEDTVHFCVKCESSYFDIDDYLHHLKINNCRSYTCSNCCFVYKRKTGLIKHLRAHKECSRHASEQVLKQCTKCLENVPAYLLMEHRKNCKVIKCTQCQVPFSHVYELSKHQMEEHSSALSLQVCKYCKKEFVGNRALENHFKRTHQNQLHLYKYRCVYCEAIFKHPKPLFAHFLLKHKDLQPYSCRICDKTFRIRKRFTIHIKLEHNSVGFVEFDENYHVFFTDKKSKKPFQPTINTGRHEHSKIVREHSRQVAENNSENTFEDENDIRDKKSDFMDLTEIEEDKIEPEIKQPKKLKRKLRPRNVQKKTEDLTYNINNTSSSDDEPLLEIKKKVQNKIRVTKKYTTFKNFSKKKMLLSREAANRFKCNYCNKQCYTFQNYHQHLNSVHKDEMKKCVKCDIIFSTKEKLSEHITQEHSSSRLTEVLKSLIEKRKKESNYPIEIPNVAKFKKTIKKVECELSEVPATVTPCSNDNLNKLSVQKFYESFIPESYETEKNKVAVESNISIRAARNMSRPPLIKLHKFEPNKNVEKPFRTKLAMPVKFKADFREEHVVKVTVVQNSVPKPNTIIHEYVHLDREESFFDNIPDHDYEEVVEDIQDQETDCQQDYRIPEVAEEIMLEGSEEIPKLQTSRKIVIPNVPDEINKMRIAHLVPDAPFYKIVKVKDVIEKSQPKKEEETTIEKKSKVVQLPDGTKLVNVNPLAHLLGDNKVLENYKPSKYYPHKTQDFQQAIAKALMKVEMERPKKTPRKKKLKTEEV